MLRPLRNNIIFVFVDKIVGGVFSEESKSGLLLGRSMDNTTKSARWGKVLAVGPEVVKDGNVKVGELILIEPLMWTESIEYDGVKIWKTNLEKVLGTSTVEDYDSIRR